MLTRLRLLAERPRSMTWRGLGSHRRESHPRVLELCHRCKRRPVVRKWHRLRQRVHSWQCRRRPLLSQKRRQNAAVLKLRRQHASSTWEPQESNQVTSARHIGP